MKNVIILLTLTGLIPFYLEKIIFFLNLFDFPIFFEFSNFYQYIYGSIVISFLSGMQWQRFIYHSEKSVYKYFLPIFSSIWAWSLVFDIFNSLIIVISGLSFCLVIELIFQNKLIPVWFKNLRIITTILAILSFYV